MAVYRREGAAPTQFFRGEGPAPTQNFRREGAALAARSPGHRRAIAALVAMGLKGPSR